MCTSEQIVTEALSWVATPYHHQACVKGVGVDCAMLLAGIAKACGLIAPDWRAPVYSPQWHLHQNEEVLTQTLEALGCRPVPQEYQAIGDILVLQYGRVSSHCAILVALHPPYIVHASNKEGDKRVVHHRLDAKLQARVRQVYVFPRGTG